MAGSLFRSFRLLNNGEPFGAGARPVSRTFAPMGTSWPLSTCPVTVPLRKNRTSVVTTSPSKRTAVFAKPQRSGLKFAPSPLSNGLFAPLKAANASWITD